MKTSPRVSLNAALMTFLLLKQCTNESNDTYFTRFKLSVETLNLAGGAHMFISDQILGMDIASVTNKELGAERERFKAI